MRKSKLFDLVKTFKNDEWKRCRKYLISQTKEDSEVVMVYDHIMKYRSNLDHNKLDQNLVLITLFKNKTLKNFQNIMSRLYGFVLEYFAVDHMRSDERDIKLHTLMSLNKRGLYDLANKAKEQYHQMIENASIDLWNELYILRANHEIKFSDSPIPLATGKDPWSSILRPWSKIKRSLNLYYLIDCINAERIRNIGVSQEIDRLLREISHNDQGDVLNQILSHLNEMVSDNSESSFHKLLRMFEEEEPLAPNIGSFCLILMIQFAHKKVINGESFLTELNSLFHLGINTGYLLTNGEISDVRFSMLTQVACFQGEMKEARKIVISASQFLNEESKEDQMTIAQATLSFYEQNYENSIDILRSYSFAKRKDKLTIRSLLLLNYYIYYQDEKDFVIDQISNYLNFIKRNKAGSSQNYINGAMNFAEIIAMLVKDTPIHTVHERISTMDSLIRRTWLTNHIKSKWVN